MARSAVIAVSLVLMMLTVPLATAVPYGRASDLPLGNASARWPGPMRGPSANDGIARTLILRAGAFDPLRDAIPTVRGLSGPSSPGVYLVQFSRELAPSDGTALGRWGILVLGFVPEGGLVVSVPRPTVAIALGGLPGVRWVCPWQSGWKVDPALAGARGEVTLTVLSWDASADISRELASAGARVEGQLLDVYHVAADASSIGRIASIAAVCWVEPRTAVSFLLDKATRIIGARAPADGPNTPDSGAVWSYLNLTAPAFKFDGTNGSSVVVDVTDTGVDGGHPAFSGKLRAYTAVEAGRPNWTDPMGHGTHVAGIVLGTGAYRVSESPDLPSGKYAGVAPGAILVAQSLYNGQYFFRNLTKWSVDHGAEISQNSWGAAGNSTWGNYTLDSREYDNATRDADWRLDGNQSILVVFAAGNDGASGNGTITTDASAKNVISVGASGNGKWADTVDQVWEYSSRGPTDDGRIKPDLVAPGDLVTSTWATSDPGTSGRVPGDGGIHSYVSYGGTSMAAPMVSGAAALVIDHLRTQGGHKDPSPALVKAMLIASADHLSTDSWPGNGQGWGRLNVSKALVPSRTQTMEWVDQSSNLTAPGESMDYSFEVGKEAPLSVSLVWTDVSAQTYSGKALVNDLDLEVRSPSGKTYLGNVFSANKSVEGGSADRTNNVEVVYIPTPEQGTWQVTVRAHELPPVPGGGSQDFAIAVSGQVNKRFVDLVALNLTVKADDAAEGDQVPIHFDVTNTGNIPADFVAWRVELFDLTNRLVGQVRAGTIDRVLPGTSTRVFLNWTAARGTYTVRAEPNPYRHIKEESYQNNNVSRDVFIKGYGFTASIPVSLGSGTPGSEVSFSLNITNTGNVRDLYLLDRQEPPPGWSARLDHTFIELLPGREGVVKLFVGVPAGAIADTFERINVTVRSQGNSTYTQELSTQTIVLAVRSAIVELEDRQLGAPPGTTTRFNFTLRNLGNGPDTYKVKVDQTGGPTDGVTFELPRTTFSVPYGGTASGNFTVSLDRKKVGSLAVGAAIAFSVKAFSVTDPTSGAADAGALIVEQLHAISVMEPRPEGFSLSPGQSVPFTVELANDGNGGESVTVDISVPSGWSWKADPKKFSIEMGGTTSTEINVTSPPSAEGTLQNITIRFLDKDGKSQLELVVPFDVQWVPGLLVTLDGASARNVTQGSEVSFTFWVKDLGNRPDTVNVTFDRLSAGLRAWAVPSDVSVGIGQRKSVQVVFNASIDALLLRGTYDVIFLYAQEARTEVMRVNLTIEQATPSGGGGGGGGGGKAAFPFLLAAVAIAVILVIVVAVVFLVRGRGKSKKLEDSFFVGGAGARAGARTPESTARAIESEYTAAGPAPHARSVPPPRPPRSDEGQVTPASGGPAGPPRCPDDGLTMITMGPGGGYYCPTCGRTNGGNEGGGGSGVEAPQQEPAEAGEGARAKGE